MPINEANWGDLPFGCIISKHPLMFDNNFDSRGEEDPFWVAEDILPEDICIL